MSRYSIEGSTLTAIGDAIREKTGNLTKIETFPVEQNTFVVPVHPENIDVTQLSDKNSYGQVTSYWYYIQDIVVPGAVKFQVNYTFDTNLVDSYAVYAFKEDGDTDTASVYCNPDGTTSGQVIKTYHNKVRIKASINKTYWENKNYSYCDFEIIGLDADGNPVTEYEAEVVNTLTPIQMAEEVQNILSPPPEEVFTITGNCSYRFANGGWDWFIKNYGNKITTGNITDANHMFDNCQLEQIPITINLATSNVSTASMFYLATKLVQLPSINNLQPQDKLCQSCSALKSINGNQFTQYAITIPCDSMFSGCLNLRSVDKLFDNLPDFYAGNSIYGMYSVFYSCYSLDELTNLPYIYSTYSNSNYGFGNFVDACYRLKELTFRAPIITSGPKAGAVLKLDNSTGWSARTDLSAYGFSNDKKVIDDASYQALKNDPDWWTPDIAYSRYNHDSAVNTINSLPDLSSLSYTNTIRFKGAAGELTDGGAINTLTEEEIAVAAAKGWTVALT